MCGVGDGSGHFESIVSNFSLLILKKLFLPLKSVTLQLFQGPR